MWQAVILCRSGNQRIYTWHSLCRKGRSRRRHERRGGGNRGRCFGQQGQGGGGGRHNKQPNASYLGMSNSNACITSLAVGCLSPCDGLWKPNSCQLRSRSAKDGAKCQVLASRE